MTRYAGTALNGGVVTDSPCGKPYVSRSAAPRFDGKNPGITDSAIAGICAMTYVNYFTAKHSMYTHTNDTDKERAMRSEFLANLSDNIRPLVATYNEKGPWRPAGRPISSTE